jgi:hypothetical protein
MNFTVFTASLGTSGLAGLSPIHQFRNLREARDRPSRRLSNAAYACQGHDRKKNRFFKGNLAINERGMWERKDEIDG